MTITPLHLLGLEPISETLADKNAYGFRPRRSTADAIEQCFKALCRRQSAQWVLEGDIKSCFDKIGHQWLLDNIIMDKQTLRKWLKCGYIDKGIFYHTEKGLAQGGIISPTLMVLTLRGLEEAAKQAAPKDSDKVNTIAYADDCVITGATREILEEKVKPAIEKFLAVRGLELSKEKTKITHINDGFDFLGFNMRKCKNKLLTKPVKQNVLAFARNIKEVIKVNATTAAGDLIRILNPKIRGWGNYYRHAVSSKTFSFVEHEIFDALCKWATRRHPNKSITWVMKKYYHIGSSWTFQGWTKRKDGSKQYQQLFNIAKLPIRRHVKVRGAANPYDPNYVDYFKNRNDKRDRNTWSRLPETAL